MDVCCSCMPFGWLSPPFVFVLIVVFCYCLTFVYFWAFFSKALLWYYLCLLFYFILYNFFLRMLMDIYVHLMTVLSYIWMRLHKYIHHLALHHLTFFQPALSNLHSNSITKDISVNSVQTGWIGLLTSQLI